MKFHYLLLALIPNFLSAQTQLDSMNRWSVSASVGIHDGMAPTKATTRLYQIQHFSLNGRYMLTNRAGIMLDVNYDFMDFINRNYNTYYVRASLQGVVNAGDILHFPQAIPRIGLLVHGGAGFSSMWSDNNPVYPNTEPLSKRADGMLNFVFGATPQYKLNEKWSVNADLSFIFHARQNNRFDMQGKDLHGAIGGYMLNAGIGVTRYFGKNKSHADWTPTQYSEGLNELKTRLATLEEQAKDDDKDGVPNGIDTEPGTPEGTLVDSKGVGVKDRDGDGIVDAYDACPDIAGTFSTNGCADSDKDGVSDNDDDCPQTPGLMSAKGCPQVSNEHKDVMKKALKDVQFDYMSNALLPASLPSLDEIVKMMSENPEYRLEIAGHTDNIGEEAENMERSKVRAQNVANYITSKGISADRLDVLSFGETVPKATNETVEGQAANRRVEFAILFY